MLLHPQEHEELAEDIWQRGTPNLAPEQIAEARRLAQAVDRGEMRTIPGDNVMQELSNASGSFADARRPPRAA